MDDMATTGVEMSDEVCPACKGTGESVEACPGCIEDCRECGGTGVLSG